MRRDLIDAMRRTVVAVLLLGGAGLAHAQAMTHHVYVDSVNGEFLVADGSPQVALQTIELPAGATLDPAQHTSEVAVVVLSGAVTLDGRRMTALDGVYAPAGEAVDATAVEPARLVQIEWVSGFEGSGHKVRQTRHELTRQASTSPKATTAHYFDQAHPAFSLSLIEAKRGAELRHAAHAKGVELLFVVEGSLVVTGAGGPWTVKKGEALRLGAAGSHQLVAGEALVALQVIAPRTK